MNLLEAPWIPVRADAGRGESRLLTYRALLCEPGQNWQISLPRDDLELACLQLLVSMTQVMFLPDDDSALLTRISTPLAPGAFDATVAPYAEWFDLDHPTQPFMQTRGVIATDDTPIQKLLIGLPEGNNHAFFNDAGEVTHLSGTLAAIALFNQASNCPSFGGGFKGSLRGGAPITTLVFDADLRRMVWRNVLTRERLAERQIAAPGPAQDQPTWVAPIAEKSTIHWNQIGLARGLFWQPARVELVKSEAVRACDVLGGAAVVGYSGFRKEKFNFTVEGVWPHPHGAMNLTTKKGVLQQKFASFTTTAPAWTQLAEFVVPRSTSDKDAKEGSNPAGPVTQAAALGDGQLLLLIGGYRTNQASVLERRHELIGLAQGWRDDKERLPKLVADPDEVAYCPGLYRLFPGQKPDDRYLRLAFVLPCCKHDAKAKSLGAQLATAKVSEARVLQMARAQRPLDLIQLRRLLAHIEPAVNWQEFGKTLWFWGERAKRQLVEDYYLAQFTPAKGDK